MKSAGFAIGLIAILAATDASAIVGGVEVAADDPGGRATVIVSRKDGSCSGLVYGESYIITSAHCLMNKDFTAPIAPQDVTVTYGRGLKQPDAVTRHVTALTIHENFLKLFTNADEYVINSEDIALIHIDGTHPSGVLGAELPTITNDYVVCCVPRARSWPLVWMDVYGFGAAPKGELLHKLRVSAVAPDAVWKGVDPKGFYRPRQLATEQIGTAGGPHGICHGDSGGPAFLVARTWSREAPADAIRLVRGHPLAIGLVTWGNNELKGESGVGCSDPFYLVRLDYYADWIRSHTRQMP
jgi:secreted trypsin-like serine protease